MTFDDSHPIPGYHGYFADDTGRIYSTMKGEARELAQFPIRGYPHVKPVTVDRKARVPVHRLIALTFHGPPDIENNQVRHLDGNPRNNRADNLRWGSSAENAQDRVAHGRQGHTILTADQVREIRRRYQAELRATYASLAFEYGVKPKTIAKAVRRVTWRHVA